MRQLAYLDIASLRNAPDWVSAAKERFNAIGKPTLLVDVALRIKDGECKKSARAFGIERPQKGGAKRGTLPDFPHLAYRWHSMDAEHCEGLDFSGNCTTPMFVALLRHMDARGFTPHTADVMMFFHGDGA